MKREDASGDGAHPVAGHGGRAARLAAAMRANLKKRKQQDRARAAETEAVEPEKPLP